MISSKINIDKSIKWLSIAFVLIAIYGGFQYAVPIPLGDEWDGFIGLLLDDQNSLWYKLWHPHNEHRIVLSKLLFLIDAYLFNYSRYFLLIINYILLAGLTGLLIYIARQEYYKKFTEANNIINNNLINNISLFILAFMFSWCQKDNLTWAFQSQFYLAYLMPLLAVYFIYRAEIKFSFVLSMIFSLLSIGTMANGIIILPIIILYSIYIKQSKFKILVYTLSSIIIYIIYFSDYQLGTISNSSTVLDPIAHLKFFVIYLGGPAYYIARGILKSDYNIIFAALAGIFGAFLTIENIFYYFIKNKFVYKEENKTAYFILFYLFYVLFSIGLISVGRGAELEMATQNRYMTVSLIVWVLLIILALPRLQIKNNVNNKKIKKILLTSLVLMLPFQIVALRDKTDSNYEKLIAGLALELGVKDMEQIGNIYPNKSIFNISEKAHAGKVTIFNNNIYSNLRNNLRSKENINKNIKMKYCDGYIKILKPIDEDDRFLKIAGGFTISGKHDNKIIITDSNKKIIGYALDGYSNKTMRLDGFKGYILKKYLVSRDMNNNSDDNSIIFKDNKNNCQYKVDVNKLQAIINNNLIEKTA